MLRFVKSLVASRRHLSKGGMPERHRLLAIVALLAVFAASIIVVPDGTAFAATRAFAPRAGADFTMNGDITIAGNTVMTCDATAVTVGAWCAAAKSGTATGTQNDKKSSYMTYIDTDSDPATFNSSAATLNVPSGTSVQFAGLYWGGRTGAGIAQSGVLAGVAAPNASKKNQIKLATPSSGGVYTTLTASKNDTGTTTEFSEFLDVTATVQAAGPGTYTAADLQSGTGSDRYGGWSLVVIYQDNSLPMRQLRVNDGFLTVNPATSASVALAGFASPPAGPVKAKLGFVTYEADKGIVGDVVQLGSGAAPASYTSLSDASRTTNNFFNAGNTKLGAAVGSRDPNDVNMMGFDLAIVNASNIIAPGATAATVNMPAPSNDVYYAAVVTSAIDVMAPFVSATKSVVDVNGGNVEPGDQLEYTLNVTNTGQDAANSVVVTDAIPANTTFVTNSFVIDGSINPVTASYLTGPARIVAKVGVGATAAIGGTLAALTGTAVVKFRVTVNSGVANATILSNTATVTSVGASNSIASTFTSSPATTATVVYNSDLAIVLSHAGVIAAGGDVNFDAAVTNVGPTVSPGSLTITDTLPTGLTFVSAGSGLNGWTCTAVGQIVTCTNAGPLAVGVPSHATIVAHAAITLTGAANSTATIAGPLVDLTTPNNTSTDNAVSTTQSDVALTISHTGTVTAGQPVTYALVASNDGPSNAAGPLTITENLPVGASLTGYTGLGWTCNPGTATGAAAVSCTNPGGLGVGSTAGVNLTIAVAASITGTLPQTASLAAATTDTVLTNNSASDPATVLTSADLSVTSTHAGAFTAGTTVPFVITVNNAGPSDAAGVVITDTLPAGFILGAPLPAGWNCSGSGTVTCVSASPLPLGNSSFTLNVNVASATAPGAANNAVTVAATTTDPVATNNSFVDNGTVIATADLSLAKSHTGSLVAGSSATYALQATNLGASDAVGPITIVDSLPTDMTVTSTNSGWTCTPATGTVTCTSPGGIVAGATTTLNLSVSIASNATGPDTNSATVSSPTTDLSPTNNAASDGPATVDSRADLAISATHTSAFVAGQSSAYVLNVANNGPSDVSSPITITDTLPTGVSLTSFSGAGWSCTPATGTGLITCTHSGSLVIGGSSSVTLNVDIASNVIASISNSASVSSAVADTVLTNNTATDLATVATRADLAVTTGHIGTPVAGSVSSFVVTVANNGPSDAAGPITVTDTLPAGFTLAGTATSGWTCTGTTTVSCTNATGIANGASASLVIAVNIASNVIGSVTNSVAAASATTDSAPANNSATHAVVVTTSADLVPTTTHIGAVIAGSPATYRVSVINNGPSDAAGPVVVNNTLPAGFTYTSTPSVDWTCAAAGLVVTCTHTAGLPVGTTVAVDIVAISGSSITGAIIDSAVVASATTDPTPTNTSADTVTVSTSANLALVETRTVVLVAGSGSAYQFDVTNNGPSDAAGPITITDTLPAGLSLTSATGSGWVCTPATGTGALTCTHATGLAATATSTLVLNVALVTGLSGSVSNSGTVTSATADPTPANNSASNTGVITVSADISVTSAHTDPIVAGSPFHYSITVTNSGPSDAVGPVTVSDTLPIGMTFTGASPAGWSCTGTTVVSCSHLAGMISAATLSFDVPVAVAPSAPLGAAANVVVASSASTDPTSSNNTVSDAGAVTALADLTIASSATGSFVAGTLVQYTLTVGNIGPSTATGISLTDPLPAGLSLVSGTGTGWTCTGPSSVSCSLSRPLAPGSTSIVVLQVSVATAASLGAISNVATVTTATPDPTPGVTSTTVNSTLTASADLSLTKLAGGTFTAGTNTATYTFNVTNIGPSQADGPITILDTLPSGVTLLVDPATGGWSCTGTTTVSCIHAAALPIGSSSVTIGVQVAASITNPVMNSAIVSSPTPDPVANNTANSGPVTVATSADLSIVASHADPFTAGVSSSYTVVVTNGGPSNAAAPVTVISTLPNGVNFTGEPVAGWTCSGTGTVSCASGTLAPGAAAALTLVLPVAVATDAVSPSADASLVVSSGTSDPIAGNNIVADPGTIVANADLAIAGTDFGTFTGGTNTSGWNLTVTNNGPSAAANATVVVPLPVLFSLVTGSTAGAGWTCAQAGSVALGATLTCDHTGPLPVGSSSALAVHVAIDSRVRNNVPDMGAITVSSTTPDATPANNAALLVPTTTAVADVALAITHTAPIVAGANVTYTLSATNNGPSDADGPFTFTVTLPAGMTLVSTPSSGWTCTGTTTISCVEDVSLGGIVVNGSVSIQLVVAPVSSLLGAVEVSGTVAGSTTDPTPANNATTSPGVVIANADLSIDVTHIGTITAGQPVTYTLAVTNHAPSDAIGPITLTDVLPAGMTFASASAGSWTCAGTTTVTCTGPTMAAHSTSSVDVIVNVSASRLPSTVSNTASVSSVTPDSVPANNTATDTSTSGISADFSITATHAAPVVAGTALAYNINVSNAGTSDAAGPITITATLPVGIISTGTSSPGWTCVGAGSVTCTNSSLIAAGASSPLVLNTVVAANAPLATTNATFVVASFTGDPLSLNNTINDATAVTASADLSLAKVSGGIFTAGLANSTYTFSVVNAGPSQAANVTVSDVLPVGLSYSSTSSVGWLCTGMITVTCVHSGVLPVSATPVPVTIVVALATGVIGSISNTATLSSTTPDPATTNNTASATVATTDTVADLSLAASHPSPVVAGTALPYTLTIANGGTSDAAGPLTVSASLPAGVSFIGTTSVGWTCTGTASVSCTIPAGLVAGGVTTLVLTTALAADAPIGSANASFTVGSATFDSVLATNTVSSATVITAVADLSVFKTAGGVFTAGQSTSSYTFSITNAGPSQAANATIVDTLPAGLTFTSSSSAGWSCTGTATVTCVHAGVLPVSATPVDLTIGVAIAASVTGAVSNSATVTSTTTDPTIANNTTTSLSTTVATIADLSVTATHVAPVVAGVNNAYTLVVTNAGASDASGPVVVTATLPAGITSLGTTSAGWTCTGTGSVICTNPAILVASATSTIALNVAVDSTAPVTTSNASFTVSSVTTDPVVTNNSVNDATVVTSSAGQSLTQTAVGTFTGGQTGAYTFSVVNAGPSQAADATITNVLPAGLTFASANLADWTCSGTTTVTCVHTGALPVSATPTAVTVTVHVAPNVTAAVTNTATLASTTADPLAADNTSVTGPTTVVTSADLSIMATHTVPVVAGTVVSYDITVANNGPSDAAGPITITGTLPTGFSYNGLATIGWTCTGTSTVICTLATVLPFGSSTILTLSALVASDAPITTSPSTFTVASATTDPVVVNSTVTDTTAVTAVVDLSVSKTSGGTFVAGQQTSTYTFSALNNGPSRAADATITDVLPAGVTFVSAVSSDWTCTGTTTVTCLHSGSLAVATPTSVTITVAIAANVTSSVNNTATISTSNNDPSTVNNTSTIAGVTVATTANLTIAATHVAPVVAGVATAYNVTVTNHGPSDAAAPLSVAVSLPAGMTITSSGTAGWTCAVTTCTSTAILAANATASFIVNVAVASDTALLTTNATFTVSSGTTELSPLNNTVADATTITATADLSLSNSAGGSFVAGQPTGTFTFAVTNAGPSQAGDATVVETLPAGITFVSGGTLEWTCSGTTVVTCLHAGVLPVSTTPVTITITVAVAANVTPVSLGDSAVLSSTTLDAVASNNVSATTISVTTLADGWITATHPTPVIAGTPLAYTVTLHNDGPSDSAGVQSVSVSLPAGVTPAGTLTPGWICDGIVIVSCLNNGVLASGGTLQFVLDTNVAADAALTTANATFTFTQNTQDVSAANNVVADATTMTAVADLDITKTAAGVFSAGESTGTYTFDVANNGPSQAADAAVTDTLPAGVTYVSGGNLDWSCSALGQVVTCVHAGRLSVSNVAASVTITVAVAKNITGSVVNSANVTSTTGDLTPVNNDATTAAIPVATTADLNVTVTPFGMFVAGTAVSYSAVIANVGPADAAGPLTVVAALPAGMNFTGTTTADWTCGASESVVTCTNQAGLLAPAGTTSLVLDGTIPAAAALGATTATFVVSSGTTDPNLGDNNATAVHTITGSADLALVKIAGGAFVAGQSSGTFTFEVTNAGPSQAANASITETLPPGVTFVSASTGDWTCTAVGQVVTCDHPANVAVSATSTSVTITVALASSVTGFEPSVAVLGSTTPDPAVGNNAYVSSPGTVGTSADLVATAAHASPVVAGVPTTFTVDVNNVGPSDAAGPVVITGTLPVGVTLTGTSSVGWTCTGTGTASVSCTNPAGITITTPITSLVLNVAVASDAPLGTANAVFVAISATGDPVTGNNIITELTTVTASADLSMTLTPGAVTAGLPSSYTVAVANAGPSQAANARVVQTLPDGVTLLGTATSGWTCSVLGQIVTCDHAGVLAASSVDTLVIDVAVASKVTNALSSSAVLTSTTSDPIGPNTADAGPTSVSTTANLGVFVTHPAPVVAGVPMSYTADVTNAGPSDAVGPLTVDVTLPADITSAGTVSSGWACTGTSTLSCTTAAGLVAGSATQLVLDTVVASDAAPATSDASFVVASPTTDSTPANNAATETTVITTVADVAFSVTPGSMTAGVASTLTFTVTNAGPSQAADVTIVETMPAGLNYVGTTSVGWTCSDSGQVVTCVHSGPLEVTSVTEFLVDVAVASNVTAPLTNTSTVTSSTSDPTVNSLTTGPIPVNTLADLAIAATHPAIVVAGTASSYAITVNNAGPSDTASPLSVTATLPAGSTSTGTTSAGWTCTGTGTVTCTNPVVVGNASIAPVLVLDVTVAADALLGTSDATLVVSSPTSDLAPIDNTVTDPTTVTASADLSATVAAGVLTAGSPSTYTVVVSNAGPSQAADATIVQTLPVGVTFVGSTTAGWSCSAVAQVVTCIHAGVLPLGAATPLIIDIAVAPGVTTAVSSSLVLSSTTPDPVTPSTVTTGSVTVLTSADLAIVASHVAPVVAGSPVDYTVAVHNVGPSDAAGLTVTATLPTGITFVSTPTSGWTCSPTGQVITCTNPAVVAFGTTSTLALTTNVAANKASGSFDVMFAASATSPDPITANNTVTDATIIAGVADVSLALSTPATVTAGTNATITATATNAGPSDAVGLTVTAALPVGMSYVSTPTAGWTCTAVGQAVTCTNPASVAPPTSSVLNIVAAVVSTDALAPATVTASLTTSSIDPTTPNNASTTTIVVASADLTLALLPSAILTAGTSTGTFTATVTNVGPSQAADATVVVTLPAGVTLATGTLATGWTCAGTSTVTCVFAGPIPVGGTPAVTFPVTIPADRTTPMTVTGSPSSTTPDPLVQPTVAPAPITVTTSADLSLTALTTTPIYTGENNTVTLTATNAGPSVAAGPITIAATLSPGVTYVSAGAPGWTCVQAPVGQVTCTNPAPIGTVPSSVDMVVALAVDAAGQLFSATAVSSTTPDPTPANNSLALTSLPIISHAELGLTFTHAGSALANPAGSVTPGTDFVATVTVLNNGPGTATGPITITDTLPAGTTFVAAGPGVAAFACSAVGQVLTCTNPGTMPIGSVTFPMTLHATPSMLASTVSNVVSVTSPSLDSVTTNNTATDAMLIAPIGDLSLSISRDNTPVAGTNVSYVLTATNSGPSDAANFSITIPIPTGTTFVSATPTNAPLRAQSADRDSSYLSTLSTSNSSWSCSPVGSTVVCNYGLLAVGAKVSVRVVLAIASSATGTMTLSATITGPTGETNAANNDAADTTPLLTQSNVVVGTTPPSSITPGENATFVINTKATGPSDVGTITVTIPLPAGVAYIGATGTGWSCSSAGALVTCVRTALAATASSHIELVVRPEGTGAISIEPTVLATTLDGTVAPPIIAGADAGAISGVGRYIPLAPQRILDTRDGNGAPKGKLIGGQTIDLQVTGRAGVPTSGVSAVVFNLTGTGATDSGFVTTWPAGGAKPNVSSLNLETGSTVANLVTVSVGDGGKVSLFTVVGTHLVADIAGYYEPVDGSTTNGRFVPVNPARVLDTRNAIGIPTTTKVGASKTITVQLTGKGGIPVSGVSAVVANLTATGAEKPGFVTAWPGGAVPNASNVNLDKVGQTRPNQIILPVSSTGTINLFTDTGTHLIVDVAGYFTDSTAPASTSGLFVALSPQRILDTRNHVGTTAGKPVSDATLRVNVAGLANIPTVGASALVANLTATDATTSGFVTAWPADGLPNVSNLNLDRAGQTSPNQITSPLSGAGTMNLFTKGGTHLIIDIEGYYIS